MNNNESFSQNRISEFSAILHLHLFTQSNENKRISAQHRAISEDVLTAQLKLLLRAQPPPPHLHLFTQSSPLILETA